jgi:dihydrofolate reductase
VASQLAAALGQAPEDGFLDALAELLEAQPCKPYLTRHDGTPHLHYARDDAALASWLPALAVSGLVLYGRVTYEGFAQAWPGMEDPFGFADKMNAMPKYVVSSTIKDPAWEHTTVLASAEQAAALKDTYQGDILIAGSATLVRGLTDLGLVDEYRLMVFPLILGTGKRLFDGAKMTRLKLDDVTSIGTDGVSVQRYTRG